MSKLKELKQWLASFPEGSEIVDVSTSHWEDDASICVRTPSDEYHNKSILDRQHPTYSR